MDWGGKSSGVRNFNGTGMGICANCSEFSVGGRSGGEGVIDAGKCQGHLVSFKGHKVFLPHARFLPLLSHRS